MKHKDIPKNFNYLKVLFLNFDRTMCAHNYILYGETEYDFYKKELLEQAEMHEDDRALPCVQHLVNQARRNGTKLICLSHTLTNLRDEYNKNFIERYYDGGFTYLTVSKPEFKISMMRAYCDAYKIPYEYAGLVEDRKTTLELAAQAGFQCFHISDVVLWHETGYDWAINSVYRDVKSTMIDNSTADKVYEQLSGNPNYLKN